MRDICILVCMVKIDDNNVAPLKPREKPREYYHIYGIYKHIFLFAHVSCPFFKNNYFIILWTTC